MLVLIEIVAEKLGHTLDVEPKRRLQSPLVWNLIGAVRNPEYQREAILRIEDVLEVAEAMVLLGVIMQRVAAAIR